MVHDPRNEPRQVAPALHAMGISPDDDVEAALDAMSEHLATAGVTCAGGLPLNRCSTENCEMLACPPPDTEVIVVMVEI
jgi:hypothetical protein